VFSSFSTLILLLLSLILLHTVLLLTKLLLFSPSVIMSTPPASYIVLSITDKIPEILFSSFFLMLSTSVILSSVSVPYIYLYIWYSRPCLYFQLSRAVNCSVFACFESFESLSTPLVTPIDTAWAILGALS
jgi:hypothetical protein